MKAKGASGYGVCASPSVEYGHHGPPVPPLICPPGVLFLVWACHWLQGFVRHFHESKRRGAPYCSRASFSLLGLPDCLEPDAKVGLPCLAMLLELWLAHSDGYRRLNCPAETSRAGRFDGDNLNNWQVRLSPSVVPDPGWYVLWLLPAGPHPPALCYSCSTRSCTLGSYFQVRGGVAKLALGMHYCRGEEAPIVIDKLYSMSACSTLIPTLNQGLSTWSVFTWSCLMELGR